MASRKWDTDRERERKAALRARKREEEEQRVREEFWYAPSETRSKDERDAAARRMLEKAEARHPGEMAAAERVWRQHALIFRASETRKGVVDGLSLPKGVRRGG